MPLAPIRRALPADIGAIMVIERQPGFDALVGRSARSIHEQLIDDPTHVYLIWPGEREELAGFAILRDIGNPHGNIYLKRIAVRHPGQGSGTALLDAVLDWAFSFGDTHRFHLDHFTDNARARRAYEKCGLRHEGILREAFLHEDGRRSDLSVMAILRHEWAAKRREDKRILALEALTPLQQKLRTKAVARIASTRGQLFEPLGRDLQPTTQPQQVSALWEKLKLSHPRSATARVLDSIGRGAPSDMRTSLLSLAPATDPGQAVDVLFCHMIASDGGSVAWIEMFSGAFECTLAEAATMLETLSEAKSPVMQDDVVVAARDRSWAIWIDQDHLTLTR